jgi:hypothetical protein
MRPADERGTPALLLGAALVVFALGLTVGLRALGEGRVRLDRIRARLAQFDALQARDRALAGYLAAKSQFDALPEAKARDLQPLMQESLPGYQAEDVRDASAEVSPGWVLRRREIAFREAPIAKAEEFVRRAEALRPPWRLSKCVLRASSRAAGFGHVVLVMEALERSP